MEHLYRIRIYSESGFLNFSNIWVQRRTVIGWIDRFHKVGRSGREGEKEGEGFNPPWFIELDRVYLEDNERVEQRAKEKLSFTRSNGDAEPNDKIPQERCSLKGAFFDGRYSVAVIQNPNRHVTLQPIREVYCQRLHYECRYRRSNGDR